MWVVLDPPGELMPHLQDKCKVTAFSQGQKECIAPLSCSLSPLE